MNKYGYLIYEDYPNNASATTSQNFEKQDYASDIINIDDFLQYNYYDFASFEPGGFDFEKPIFTFDALERMPYVSEYISNAQGQFVEDGRQFYPTITITPSDAYSGSGFSIRTQNNFYHLQIVVEDEDGTRSKYFYKSDDEFYAIPYNGLQSAKFIFGEVKPFHFLKFVGFNFGTTRLLQDSDFVEEPIITTNFSLTGEELEYDTLDFTIRGNKDNFNFITGEKITHSISKRDFYVDNATINNNGTISVNCYDRLSTYDKEFTGIMRHNENLSDVMSWVIGSTVENPIASTFSGSISADETYREAARLLMLGSGTRLYRKNWQVKGIDDTLKHTFNEHNIVNGVPTVERLERYKNLSFDKHYFTVNKKDGRVEAFNGLLPPIQMFQQIIPKAYKVKFSEPFSSIQWYYVSGQDQSGDDILTPVSSDKFRVTTVGTYKCRVLNSYTERIVAMGYPYNESYYKLSITDDTVPNVYRENDIDITDCTVIVDMTSYDAFLEYLKHIYSYRKKISFDSVLEADEGDYVNIEFDGNEYEGYITVKQDRMNGVYGYEVMCL